MAALHGPSTLVAAARAFNLRRRAIVPCTDRDDRGRIHGRPTPCHGLATLHRHVCRRPPPRRGSRAGRCAPARAGAARRSHRPTRGSRRTSIAWPTGRRDVSRRPTPISRRSRATRTRSSSSRPTSTAARTMPGATPTSRAWCRSWWRCCPSASSARSPRRWSSTCFRTSSTARCWRNCLAPTATRWPSMPRRTARLASSARASARSRPSASIGRALDGFVRKPLLRAALAMMRVPAQMAGLRRPARLPRARVQRVPSRWTAPPSSSARSRRARPPLHRAIADGASDPFPDPGPPR